MNWIKMKIDNGGNNGQNFEENNLIFSISEKYHLIQIIIFFVHTNSVHVKTIIHMIAFMYIILPMRKSVNTILL